MEEISNKKTKLYFLLILGIIGFLTSLYLIQNHYVPQGESVCDIGAKISCSIVNSSVFSELLNVPVAVLGAIWFLVLLYLAHTSLSKNGLYLAKLYYWNIIGLIFVAYMIIGEIILKALCPACTLVHLIVIAMFLVTRKMYINRMKFKQFLNRATKFIVWIVVIFSIPLLFFNTTDVGENQDVLAKCLNENGVKMYSSFLCGHCKEQKDLFGNSFNFIEEIECHPDGPNSRFELCQAKEITGTPTWIMEKDGKEFKRNVGFMPLEELKAWAGCHDQQ